MKLGKVIKGAMSGIDKEVAKLLAKAGLKVFPTGRNETESFQGFALFNHIREVWGGVRVLINNAGLGYKVGLLDENSSKWREMLETNVLAPTLCAQ